VDGARVAPWSDQLLFKLFKNIKTALGRRLPEDDRLLANTAIWALMIFTKDKMIGMAGARVG
jgi:hypothetical protein